MHRLTIHRTDGYGPVSIDFTLPDPASTTIEEALRFKTLMVYDIDNPVYALIINDADNVAHGISVATHQIDHIILEPVPAG